MGNEINKFKDVTLLITHYNRSGSLERLLSALEERACLFEDIVVSDDCSRPEHLNAIKSLQNRFSFQLIESPVNRGLGNNINKGQDAVTTSYTLYIQEDFVPTEQFTECFANALDIINERPDLDIIRFYSYLKYPYMKAYKKGFSEMIIKPWFLNHLKIYYYSDHPHLRRSDFFQKFGHYAEGLKGDRIEYRMCVSFIQNKGKGLFFDNYKSLFVQENSEDEPSTMKRKSWTTSKKPIIALIRKIYRQIRYNFDILFVNSKR